MAIRVETIDPHEPICAELIAELSAELGAIYGDDGSAKFKPEDVMGARAAFVVVWLDDLAMGCGAIRPLDDARIAEIKRMYVRKAGRGKGLSYKILQKLEALAAQFKYHEIWLETGIHQHAAVRLYESAGYARMGCYGDYITNPESLCYCKPVAISD